ncbi:MAG: hypothetical protein HYR63_24515 [Proteobacteria bacterium]|nr:hypothetical protein [Pseudomonadota bacterium]
MKRSNHLHEVVAAFLAFCLVVGASAATESKRPLVVGEWAGNCSADFRIGYKIGPDGELIAYTVDKGAVTEFGRPKFHSEGPEFFALDFNDGAPPIIWKKEGESIRPWKQGEGEDAPIKDGKRNGKPTATFLRCR